MTMTATRAEPCARVIKACPLACARKRTKNGMSWKGANAVHNTEQKNGHRAQEKEPNCGPPWGRKACKVN
jgi:hypothetical protein